MNILYPIVFVASALFVLFTVFLLEFFFSRPDIDEEIGEEDER